MSTSSKKIIFTSDRSGSPQLYEINTKSKRNTFLVTFNGKKDGDKYYLSDHDKKLSLKTRKKFIDDQ